MPFGTLSLADTLGGLKAAEDKMLSKYDPATLYNIINMYISAYNEILAEMEMDLIEPTNQRQATWGGYDYVEMQDGDEYSRPDAKKIAIPPVAMGYPLAIKQAAWQVTQLFMETKSLGDLDKVVNAAVAADKRSYQRTLRSTVFNPTNNLSYLDRFVDNYPLQIRTFLNADGTVIPPDEFGNTFDPSAHTHFLAESSLSATGLKNTINTVKEHYSDGEMLVYINAGDEDTVTALTGFKGYVDPRITPTITEDQALQYRLDIFNTYNRRIGIFGASEIWTKPWIPSGYLFAFNKSAPKPIWVRTRNAQRGSFRIAAQIPLYPLQATYAEREYGMAVYERTNGACLYFGGASYTPPNDMTFFV
jgi:hypothetical protein